MLEDVWEQTPEEKARIQRNNRICFLIIKRTFNRLKRKIKRFMFN